jgi:hypothetical protein
MRYEKLYNKFTLWANQNIVIKLLVATIMIALKLLLTSLYIWAGLFLVGYLTNLPYMNFLQSLAVVLWIKIILFNLTPKKKSNMWLYIFKDLINTRVIFYKGGLILYRKMAVDGSVMLVVKLFT